MQFQEELIEIELEAENLLLARHEVIKLNMNEVCIAIAVNILMCK